MPIGSDAHRTIDGDRSSQDMKAYSHDDRYSFTLEMHFSGWREGMKYPCLYRVLDSSSIGAFLFLYAARLLAMCYEIGFHSGMTDVSPMTSQSLPVKTYSSYVPSTCFTR